jgi:hypothetical protein
MEVILKVPFEDAHKYVGCHCETKEVGISRSGVVMAVRLDAEFVCRFEVLLFTNASEKFDVKIFGNDEIAITAGLQAIDVPAHYSRMHEVYRHLGGRVMTRSGNSGRLMAIRVDIASIVHCGIEVDRAEPYVWQIAEHVELIKNANDCGDLVCAG